MDPPEATRPQVEAWGDDEHAVWLYRLLRSAAAPLIRGLFATRTEGLEKIPKRGPVILASNHCSNLDPVLVVGSVPRPIFHLGKHTLFTTPNRARFFQTLGGQIPVHRGRGGNEAAIDAAVRCLEQGHAFGIYPEGGRSPDGRVGRGHTGVARIAVRTGVPVFPVAIAGTHEVWPKGQKLPKILRRTRVVVGAPRTYAKAPEMVTDLQAMQGITDEIMGDVARLLGQDYDPARAPRLRSGLD